MDLFKIKDPSFLKTYNNQQLKQLSDEIRDFLIETVSITGGHLSSNLGTVELSVALHKVFDSPKDQILLDVGHQSYTHKILTGRANRFATLRQLDGLSGFQKRTESDHDVFEAGHAGTALSAALGMAIARDLDKKSHHIIAVLGDGSLTNGEVYEALNQIGEHKTPLIIILNDNAMSISKNVGHVSNNLNKLRVTKSYNVLKSDVKGMLDKGGVITKPIASTVVGLRNLVRKNVVDENLFTDFGLKYVGPFDGHNIAGLVRVLEFAKQQTTPLVVHLKTTKGKGYAPSEKDTKGNWHGVGQFALNTGETKNVLPPGVKSSSDIVSSTLLRLAQDNQDIVAITPAMKVGSKLENFFKKYPQRSFDTGITESHSATFAAGLALSGKHPFLSIYSTFLQRAYDQINHDIARMNLPVVIGIDRAGLVGEDGETHHGVFDIGILKPIPNMIIAQGKDSVETQNLLYTAFQTKQPFALRYGRGNEPYNPVNTFSNIAIGSWDIIKLVEKPQAIILTYGREVTTMENKAKENNYPWWIVNMRFIKPIDTNVLEMVFKENVPLFVYETDLSSGGISEDVVKFKNEHQSDVDLNIRGIGDNFVQHGSLIQLRKQQQIDTNSVTQWILDYSRQEE